MHDKQQYYEPSFRPNRILSGSRTDSDRLEKYAYISPEPSIDTYRKRFRLASPINDNSTSLFSSHLSQNNSRALSHKFDPIDRNITELERELAYKKNLKMHLEKSKYRIWNQKIYRMGQNGNERIVKQRTEENTLEDQQIQPVWHNPDIFASTRKKIKIYKIKPKKTQQFGPVLRDLSQQLPLIDKIRLKRFDNRRSKEHNYQIIKPPAVIGKIYTRHRENYFTKKYQYYRFRRFRKVAHAILFTIYLRKYNERMRRNREGFFEGFVREKVKDKLLSLKNYLIQHSQPFFLNLISQNSFDYSIYDKDEPELRREKQRGLRHLIELQLNCLEKSVRKMAGRQFFAELLYYLCKHGNYSPSYQLDTPQELGLLCVSETYGYVSADKYLERSAILSLVFFKILLFNIMLQPSKLDIFINYTGNKETIFKNIRIIGNILYQLFIDIQDNLLQRADGTYTIGNWKKTRFETKVAQSMSVKAGFFQKNQLISGLADHKYIKQVYGTKFMIDYKHLIEEMVKILHCNIVDFHTRIRKKYF